ncbi:hypothetical protein AB4391_16175 [Vibrio lentus]|uniref:SH3 domain-containing protein n=1 Tax=Vibrio lentus TaxID=136468 RepID=A0A2N7JZI6_9VIBR|nr:hypothetical protein [Vibrio lentus]PMM66040.1 hypothetical protein BCT49_12890 [Vibrio lentus]
MKNHILVPLIFVTLSGCAASIPQNAKTEVKSFSTPKISVLTSAYVGDFMIDQGKATTKKYLTVHQSIDGAFYNISQGSYVEMGYDGKKSWFNIYSTNGGLVSPGAFVDPPYALSVDETKQVCVSSVIAKEVKCYEGTSNIEDKTINDSASFRQTLIYNGSVGTKLNISYREFTNDMARGAFTNDVEYDMSKSNLINYKGARIEVLNYDNSSIEFKVLKHFRENVSVTF